MPELPEVETVVRGLEDLIVGTTIIEVIIKEAKLIGYPDMQGFRASLPGRKISSINRRGKYILINLSENKTMVVHLRMTGKLLVKDRHSELEKHTHIIFKLDNKTDLRFNNLRKFGRIYLVNTGDWEKAGGLANLGPEPLSSNFTLSDFKDLFKNRKTKIKSLLLNQKFIAGLGNIYADEALFRAGILPQRGADSLTDQEIKKLYQAIREVLSQGIKYGGTTFSDYLNAFGQQGRFQAELQVYRQTGEDCPKCGQEIVREKIGGRSSHYCPHCQK